MRTPRWVLLILFLPLVSVLGEIELPEEAVPNNSASHSHPTVSVAVKPAPAPALAPEPAKKPAMAAWQAVVSLTDGSRVVGVFKTKTVDLETSYAQLSIAWEKVAQLEFDHRKEATVLQLRNGDRLQGQCRLQSIEMQTSFGAIKVPQEFITSIKIEGAVAADESGGLVLHLTCDHIENGRLVDLSPTKLDGLVHGATAVREGKIDGALKFNGQSDYVLVPYNEALNFAPDGQFTLAFWVKPQLEHRCQALVVKGATEYWDWGIFLNADGTFFSGCPGNDKFQIVSQTVARDDNWYHLAVTYKNRAWVLYVNGQAEASATGGKVRQSGGGLALSRKGETDGYPDFSPGLFDDVRIYKRALNAEDVRALYDRGESKPSTGTPQ